MVTRSFKIEGDGEDIETCNEINFAVNGKALAVAASSFLNEVRYRFKHRELDEKEERVYQEIMQIFSDEFDGLSGVIDSVM